MHIRRRDKNLLVASSLVFLGASLAGWFFIGVVALIFLFGAALVLLFALNLETYRRVDDALEDHYKQVESLFSLFFALKPNFPLPPMRGWAISPDFANLLLSLIQKEKPKLIIEAGSGVSTLVAGYCLREIGEGKIISLDHNQTFAEASRNNLPNHGLSDAAEIVHAPLKEFSINGEKWLWYDTSRLEGIGPIDMLIVDGPPNGVQKMARYPALPILIDQLSENAIVLLDDAFRGKERLIIERWLREFTDFSRETIHTEKGAVILRRTGSRLVDVPASSEQSVN